MSNHNIYVLWRAKKNISTFQLKKSVLSGIINLGQLLDVYRTLVP